MDSPFHLHVCCIVISSCSSGTSTSSQQTVQHKFRCFRFEVLGSFSMYVKILCIRTKHVKSGHKHAGLGYNHMYP